MSNQVIIIGAGITGLTAAKYLAEANIDFKIIESDSKIGGRVQSKSIDGYIIDKGFQVLLTAYPEVQKNLDLDALKLKNFDPGALLLMSDGTKRILGDPLRDINSLIPTLVTTAATFSDKLKIFKLSNQLKNKTIEQIFQSSEQSTLEYLKTYGFSDKVISNFFIPFFSGIFLEAELKTSSRMFEFVFKMFSEGFAALPQNGMQAIPDQLASYLPAKSISLNEKVNSISGHTIQTEKRELTAERIIIATDELSNISASQNKSKFCSTTHFHFLSDTPVIQSSIIALNTNKEKLINNLSVVNQVQLGYGQGKHLISASSLQLLENFQGEQKIKDELKLWFPQAENWRLLDIQTIRYALPSQLTVSNTKAYINQDNKYYGGDYMMNGSLHSAMNSGRKIAEEIIADLT